MPGDFYDQPADTAEAHRWYNWAVRSQLPPVIRAAKTIRKHDSATIARFLEDFKQHGGQPATVQEIALDMSAAFTKGTIKSRSKR